MAIIDPPTFRVVSGGQTGADRAALDAALSLSLDHGGWCPRGRRAEDGEIHPRYRLTETDSAGYRDRTRRNVEDTDGTLIFNKGELQGGTLLTRRYAETAGRPCKVVDPDDEDSLDEVLLWITDNRIKTLNVAGPRASRQPLIYRSTYHYLRRLLGMVITKQV